MIEIDQFVCLCELAQGLEPEPEEEVDASFALVSVRPLNTRPIVDRRSVVRSRVAK